MGLMPWTEGVTGIGTVAGPATRASSPPMDLEGPDPMMTDASYPGTSPE